MGVDSMGNMGFGSGSGILGMANALGHEAGSLSVILANRSQKTFHSDVEEAVEKLIDTGIELFHQL
jgi:uridine phosphorylase